LLARQLLIAIRRPSLNALTFLSVFIFAMICKVLWPQTGRDLLTITEEQARVLFAVLFITIMLPHSNVRKWIEVRNVTASELALRQYGTVVFCITQTLVSACETLITVLPFLLLAPPEAHVMGPFFLLLLLHSWTVSSVVEAWAFYTGNESQTHFYSICTLLMSIIFAGFIIPVQQMPMGFGWLSHFSITESTYSGMLTMTFANDPSIINQLMQPVHRTLASSVALGFTFWSLARTFFFVAIWKGTPLP
jgi:hypothetical protein